MFFPEAIARELLTQEGCLHSAGDLGGQSAVDAAWKRRCPKSPQAELGTCSMVFFPLLNLYLVPSAGDVERARALKEEGNELVKNHKQAIEKYSESLWFSNLESATYSNRYLSHGWPRGFQDTGHSPQSALGL